MKKTDITDYALQAIASSKIKELYLVGRRGPLNVAFTIKELREQIKLENCATIWRKNDFVAVADAVNSLPRPRKRLTELMLKSLNENDNAVSDNQKVFKPIFYRSPKKFLVNSDRHLQGIELTCNTLIGDKIEEQTCVPTEDSEILNCSLAFRSIGYKSIQVDKDLPLNSNGVVINENGRVTSTDVSNLAKLYVAGWLGTGPVGVILHTMGNAFQVAKLICEDLKKQGNYNKGGFLEVKSIINERTPVIDWSGWEKIDKYETEEGKKLGKPREKIAYVEKMIQVALS